jgi:hypothetical protein
MRASEKRAHLPLLEAQRRLALLHRHADGKDEKAAQHGCDEQLPETAV